MPKDITGQTALLTGAARRLGRATAEALAAAGANVVIHYNRSADAANALVDQLRAAGHRAEAVGADLADEAETAALVARASEAFGPLDMLVNNASIFPPGELMSFSFEQLAENVRINAYAPLVLARQFAAQGRPGSILNFIDSRYNDYDRPHADYHLSKRMFFSITRMLALELAPRIAVNAVAPGLVLGPPGEEQSYLDERAHLIPMQAPGAPGDVAEAALFLLTSRFITGQIIFVDGGRHMKGSVYD